MRLLEEHYFFLFEYLYRYRYATPQRIIFQHI